MLWPRLGIAADSQWSVCPNATHSRWMSVCAGCRCVFIRDGQRFCGLCQWRTASGAAYQ
ncbi:unnamed protein product, partial [Allacma fusca]